MIFTESDKIDIGTINIKNTIKLVKSFDKHGDIKKLFTEGFCYDFAIMLYRVAPESRIFYIKNKRHTILEYRGKYYDIDGEYKISPKDKLIESDYIFQSEKFGLSRSSF